MALVKSDGSAVTKAPGASILEPVTQTDPRVTVKENIYEVTPYDHVNYPTQKRQLAFPQGAVIRQSEWDKKFAAAAISSVTPSTGGVAGGTQIVIRGTGFPTSATVTVGGANATAVVVVNDNQIKCTTPAGTAGAKDVVVNAAGGNATKTGGFTYS